jgi:hypothetical protein
MRSSMIAASIKFLFRGRIPAPQIQKRPSMAALFK